MPNIKLVQLADGNADADITSDGIEIMITGASVETTPPPPVDPSPPTDPAPPTITGQTLTVNKTEIHAGDTFTVKGVLNYSDGSSKPVTANSLYGFNTAIVRTPHSWEPHFTAIAEGTTMIKNDNSGTTGKIRVTVIAGTPPVDPPPVDPPPVDPPPVDPPPVDPPPVDPPPVDPPPVDPPPLALPPSTSPPTHNVVSQTPQMQSNVPVTFGQVFKAGDVPSGATLTASLDGQPVTLQVDPKATHADGSLRHAVLTAIVPSLAGQATIPLALSTGSPPAPGAAITLSQLLATNYDTGVSLNVGGKTYTLNARALLQAASVVNAAAPWNTQCNLWLSGPLVSEWVVNGPVTAADGTTDPQLRIAFAVRAYAGPTPGTVGDVCTDIIVEYTSAYGPQGKLAYTATLVSGDANYTSAALIQYPNTRWHKVLWWNDVQPQVYLQQDTQYIQNSMAVSRYMLLTPDETFLAGLRQSVAPLGRGDQTQTMGDQGEQQAIGPLPRWTSLYIVSPDVRAYNWMLANTDALGTYSIHYRDGDWPLSIQMHPYATIIDGAYAHGVAKQDSDIGRAYKADLVPDWTGNSNVWDDAHQPAEGYVAYMVTGSYYYMEEVAFGASHNELWSNEAYRGYSQGLIDAAHSQVRGKAWVLREMANAAYILPDSYPLKAEFNADVENSLTDWNTKYTNNPNANPLGLMNQGPVYDMYGGTDNGTAPWQHSFLTWSAGHAAELGFAGAAEFRNWLAKFEIGLMTDWQSNPAGYCWLEASAYEVRVKDSAGKWLPDMAAVYAATHPYLTGMVCNSPEMVVAIGKQEKQPWQAGEMPGYPYSPVGFPANLQIGLAAAVDSGLPNGAAAWTLFDSRSVKPAPPDYGYNNFPNFAVIPRT